MVELAIEDTFLLVKRMESAELECERERETCTDEEIKAF